MRIIAKATPRDFWEAHSDAENALRAWIQIAKAAKWANSAEIRESVPTASVVGKRRIVFNICHNDYRLIVAVAFTYQIIYIRFIGTHAEYDGIAAREA